MNLNRDEIVKALECCIKTQCENCCNLGNWHEQWNCMTDLMRNALALINQLTEDNTKLANLLLEKDVIILEQGKFVEENERLKTELRQTAQKLKAVEEVNDEWAEKCERLKKYYEDGEKYLGYSIAYNIDQATKVNAAPDNKCVACGETIPEGRQVCPGCEGGKR